MSVEFRSSFRRLKSGSDVPYCCSTLILEKEVSYLVMYSATYLCLLIISSLPGFEWTNNRKNYILGIIAYLNEIFKKRHYRQYYYNRSKSHCNRTCLRSVTPPLNRL